jgi:DNA repair protein RecO (recombination protein O)
MEWAAPGIVLSATAYGEGDALASVFTEEHGYYRGLVKGGASRSKIAIWQQGNLVQARWAARLADQLGGLTGELVHPAAALALDDALSLSMLSAACAVAEGALPEREPHPRIFSGLLRLLAHLPLGAPMLTDMVKWEIALLAELGFGLDLERCAVTGETANLAFVSPRTGRAVSAEAAEPFKDRLLPLPNFLRGNEPPDFADWAEGLRLTGHFLARDVFGARHKPVPAARAMLLDRVQGLTPPPDPA